MKTSPTAAAAPTPPANLGFQPWALLCVLAGNMLIDALEVSVAVIALPSIGAELGPSPAGTQWVMTGFAAGFGGTLLLGARLVEMLGHRRVYLAALLLFALASLAGALAPDLAWLTATRFVKGCAAALTAPTGLAIITTAFPEGTHRTRAMSVYALFAASGFALGLLLSGLLTCIDWRLTLAFPAPVVLLLFAPAARLIPTAHPRAPGSAAHGPRTLITAATFTASLALLVEAVTALARHGWADPRSGGALAAAVCLGTVSARIERTSPRPLLHVRLLADKALARSALGAACLNGTYLGTLFTATYQLQNIAGWSPLRTAIALLPGAAPLALAAAWSPRMVARVGAARLIALGAPFPLAATTLLLASGSTLPYTSRLLPALLLTSTGFLLAFTALNMQATSRVPAADRAAAGGLYQTAVQTGAAIAVAAVSALLQQDWPQPSATAARPGLICVTALATAATISAMTGLRHHHD